MVPFEHHEVTSVRKQDVALVVRPELPDLEVEKGAARPRAPMDEQHDLPGPCERAFLTTKTQARTRLLATYSTLAGRSASRRMYHGNQYDP